MKHLFPFLVPGSLFFTFTVDDLSEDNFFRADDDVKSGVDNRSVKFFEFLFHSFS